MERQIIEAAVADFRRRYDSSAAIRRLLEKVESGTATYADAQDYVRETMGLQTAIWETWLFPADLPDDEARRRVAAQLTRNVLDENYELVSAYAQQVQQELNRKATIGLKAQRAKKDRSRAEGLVQVASDPDRQAQLPALAENYARSIVDSTVQANADFQYKAGLRPKIRRMTDGKCCEWCSRLAGVYDYPDVPKDVFRRHANCGCVVEYDPGDGKNVRNVHTKQWTETSNRAKLSSKDGETVTESPRSASNGTRFGREAIVVDEDYIQSQEYRMRFRGITGDDKVEDRIVEQCRRVLKARSGTLKESLVLLNYDTGTMLGTVFDSKKDNQVSYSEQIIAAIQSAQNQGIRIIAIHNHPEGLPPTADDCVSAAYHGYTAGVVCGHNGSLYIYYPASRYISMDECDAIHDSVSYQCGFLNDYDEISDIWLELMGENGLKMERR